MTALLEVEKLEVTFGRTAAVRGASLTVAAGETHCLVGESGCGKSVTALSVMNLLARSAQRRAAYRGGPAEGHLQLLDLEQRGHVSDLAPNMSRRPSPKRLMPSTSTNRQTPGITITHGLKNM